MKRQLIVGLVAVMAVAMVVPGCSGGSTVTQEMDFANFTRVEVENAFEVEIAQGATFATSITVSKDLVDYLAVSVEGDVLHVKLNPHHPFTDFTLKRLTAKAKVTMPAISGLSLSGASSGSLSGFKSTGSFNLVVSGASSLKMDEMETGPVRMNVDGASRVNGDLKATEATLVLTGASHVELTGSAESLRFDVSGASNLGMSWFTVSSADATVSGASQATVDARVKLDVTLSGASRLTFRSNPTIGRLDVSGASTLKHQ